MTLNPFDPRIDSFRSDPNQAGLDLRRSIITNDPGIYVATPTASFRAGQFLALNAAGNLDVCNGTGGAPLNVPFGIAKWNKLSALQAAAVDEPVVLTAFNVVNLRHANIFPGATGGVSVRSAPGQGGTTYTEGTASTNDYFINYTNGTIQRSTTPSTIPSGSTVYVSYTYQVADADLDFQGRNFFNFLDDVTIAQGRVALVQGWSVIFTTVYDPSITYAIGNAVLVDGGSKAGILTTTTGGGRLVVGRVIQLPSASDPYLGVASYSLPV